MTAPHRHHVTWIDGGRWPSNPPNPHFPTGVDVIAANDGAKACTVALPYPAKRIGQYMVKCLDCGLRAMVTTAGRPDDPRSIRIGCKPRQADH